MPGKSKYYDIKERIEEMILRGEYPPGSQLPSEPELTRMFNASRGTIRQALGELAGDTIIARRSGAGTFVLREPGKSEQIVSLTEQIKRAGMTPVTQILAKERLMADKAGEPVCAAFFIDLEQAAETPIYRIDRLRCGDERPLARQTLYLLASDFADLLEKEDLTKSIYATYDRYQRHVTWANENIQARPATPEEIDLLEMQELPPQQQFVYERNRVSYDQENMPLEVMVSIDRGDFFKGYRYRIVASERQIKEGNEDQ